MYSFTKPPETGIEPSATETIDTSAATSSALVTRDLYGVATEAVDAAGQEMIRSIERPKERDRVIDAASEWVRYIKGEGKSTRSPNNQEEATSNIDNVVRLLEGARSTLDSRYKNTWMWPGTRENKETLLSGLARKVPDQVIKLYDLRYEALSRQAEQGPGLNDITLHENVEKLWNEVSPFAANAPGRQEESTLQITIAEKSKQLKEKIRSLFQEVSLATHLNAYESRHTQFAQAMENPDVVDPSLESKLNALSMELQSISIATDVQSLIKPANQARGETEARQRSGDDIGNAPGIGSFSQQGKPSEGTSRKQQVAELTAKYQQWGQDIQQWRGQIPQRDMQARPGVRLQAGTSNPL